MFKVGVRAGSFALFVAGVIVAYLLVHTGTRGFQGTFNCENFGLPEARFSRLRIDRELNVYGEYKGHRQQVGRLDLRVDDLAYFDINRETLVRAEAPIDPLAQYIVDNAGDSLLIMEIENNHARRAFVCRRSI